MIAVSTTLPIITRLEPSFESLGRILTFISQVEPFSAYGLGTTVRAIQDQLVSGEHAAAMAPNGEMVGYAGWVITSSLIAQLWIADKAALRPVERPGDAAALTIVVSRTRESTTRLIRAAREFNPGVPVFFKRGYEGALKPSKKAAVFNRTEGRGPSF